jgi:hypothetical protein
MQIGLLLQKYAKLGFGQKRIKEIVLATLSETFSIEIDPKDVEVKDTEVKIKVSGVRKAHMMLLRETIEKTLQENLSREGFSVSKIF